MMSKTFKCPASMSIIILFTRSPKLPLAKTLIELQFQWQFLTEDLFIQYTPCHCHILKTNVVFPGIVNYKFFINPMFATSTKIT